MQIIIKKDADLDSVNKVYSILKNLETIAGKDLVDLLYEARANDQNSKGGYACFKKITNKDTFKLLSDTGKATDCFVSHYDSIEHISRRALFNLESFRKELFKRGLNKEKANNVLRYIVSLVACNNEEVRREVYFLVHNKNKLSKAGKSYFIIELEEIPDEVENMVFYKDKEDEDGKPLTPTSSGQEFLDAIHNKTIVLDLAKRNQIEQIIEDAVNLYEGEAFVDSFLEIAKILEINIV